MAGKKYLYGRMPGNMPACGSCFVMTVSLFPGKTKEKILSGNTLTATRGLAFFSS